MTVVRPTSPSRQADARCRGKRPGQHQLEALERRTLLSSAVPVGGPVTVPGVNPGEASVRVSADTDGDFVLGWTYGESSGVGAQRFNASGNPFGSTIALTGAQRRNVSVGLADSGQLALAYLEQFFVPPPGQSFSEARLRTYSSSNVQLQNVLLGTSIFFPIPRIDVASRPDGSGAMVHGGFSGGELKRYTTSGTLGSGAGGLSYGTNDRADVAVDPDGDVIVVWSPYGDVRGQRVSSTNVVSPTFTLPADPTGDQRQARVAMDDSGNFVAAWIHEMTEVRAQRFDASGARVGDEIIVATGFSEPSSFGREGMDVAMDADGDFVVVWQIQADNSDLVGRTFTAAGVGGPVFPVHTTTTGFQSSPVVSMSDNGRFVVAWRSDFTLQAQRFELASDTIAPTVSADALEFDARQAISLTFSEPLDPTSLSAADLTALNLDDNSTPAANSVILSGGNTVATWVFNTPGTFISDGDYRFTLPAGAVSDVAGNALATPHVVTGSDIFFLAGDANRDRSVNLADFNTVAANFGQSNRTFGQGDFTYDGMVNLSDFNVLASRFGTSTAAYRSPSSALDDVAGEDAPAVDLLK